MLTGKFAFCFLFLLLLVAGSVAGEEFEFDIFTRNDSMVVAIDLGPLLNTNRLENLKDGIRYAIWLKVDLLKPRKIWGAETIQTTEEIIHIRYRKLTDDFTISKMDHQTKKDSSLSSIGKLHLWLSEAIATGIASLDSLEYERGYEIRFDINLISGSLIQLPSFDTENESSGSPVKLLFNTFLELTGYGKEQFSGRSRLFMLDELEIR